MKQWFSDSFPTILLLSMFKTLSLSTYLQTGHLHEPLSQFSWRYDSRSKHWMCLHSCPLAGSVILLKVIGHFRETLRAVCSTASLSLSFRLGPEVLLKFLLILATQCSAANSRFLSRPWSTDRTLGLCTSCNTNRCDWNNKLYVGKNVSSLCQYLFDKLLI